MSRELMIGHLFDDEPARWGLRGDPYLWRKMKIQFAEVALPSTVSELDAAIRQGFLELSGHAMTYANNFTVPEFAHGGMSSGGISPRFWRDQLLPLLLSRHAEIYPGD